VAKCNFYIAPKFCNWTQINTDLHAGLHTRVGFFVIAI